MKLSQIYVIVKTHLHFMVSELLWKCAESDAIKAEIALKQK